MKEQVDSSKYNIAYYSSDCDGWELFKLYKGKRLPSRLQVVLKMAGPVKGKRILDYGCGRGELVMNCALLGSEVVGIDYSKAAIDLANEATKELPNETQHKITFIQFNIKESGRLPYPDNNFDNVFLCDVVEHLHNWEIDEVLKEIHRVLKLGGKLILDTPNKQAEIGYKYFTRYLHLLFNPLIKLVIGKNLPFANTNSHYVRELNINFQTKESIKLHLDNAGFKSKFRLNNEDQIIKHKRLSLTWFLYLLYFTFFVPGFIYPLNLIFGRTIWVIAEKQ